MTESARRLDRGSAQEAILDAAELVFAEHGYDGASTRAIAERAGVNQALIHYHFRTKEQLFEAAFTGPAQAINAERRALLDALGPGRPALEEVLTAFLLPTVRLGHDGGAAGAAYARLVVHVASGTDARSRRLTAAQYDPIAREFIAAIRAALPGLDRAAAVEGYLHAVAIGVAMTAPTNRAAGLGGRDLATESAEERVARAVIFIAAGLRAMAAAHPDTELSEDMEETNT